MKKLFVLFLALSLLSSFAVASTDDPSDPTANNLANLNYYVHLNTFYLAPSYVSAFHLQDGSSMSSTSAFSLMATYGLLRDGFRVSVSEGTSVAGTIGNSSVYSSGITDPTFHATYRLVSDSPKGLSADAELSFSPSWVTANLSSTTTPGSSGKGFGWLEATASGYWRYSLNEVRLAANLIHDFSGNAVSQTNPNNFSYTRDSLWQFNTSLTDRIHFLPRWYFDAEATLDCGYSVNYHYTDGVNGITEVPFHITPLIRLGYLAFKQLTLDTYVQYSGDTTDFTNDNGFASETAHRSTTWGFDARIEL